MKTYAAVLLAWRCRPTAAHLRYAYYDLRAFLGGWCNHCPWDSAPGESGGGYAHWRCRYRRRHTGKHRFNNYVWATDGRVDYVPVPHGVPAPPLSPWPCQTHGTTWVQMIRQLRNRKHLVAQFEKGLAARREERAQKRQGGPCD